MESMLVIESYTKIIDLFRHCDGISWRFKSKLVESSV